MNRKHQRALDLLLSLIAQGVEYPEAEWQASGQGKSIDCSTLRDLYDAHCAANDTKHKVLNQGGNSQFVGSLAECERYVDYCQARGIYTVVAA